LADLFQKKAFIQKCGICGETGHSKGSCPKRPIAQSKFTRSYFTPLTLIVPPDSDGEKNGGGGYDEDDNRWIEYDPPLTGDTNATSPLESSQPEMYDQLLSKLSPPIQKMCLFRKAQEEEMKESDEWLSSLQYLDANINDLTISESFLDPGSEFGGINDLAIKALGWKADKPSNFAIKGNSKHITDSLGWYTDVPVTLKDKEDKTITVIGNFVRIDNGETEPMLFFDMSNI
ncbi:7184_t:CDS:2, partial [Rhizophagus irregularis]